MENIKGMNHKDLINGIIDEVVNTAEIERCLEIPQGSLSKMLTQDSILPEEIALLRMIYAFPWLVNIAGNNFFMPRTNKVVLQRDIDEAVEYIRKKGGVSKWEDTNPAISNKLFDASLTGAVINSPESETWTLRNL